MCASWLRWLQLSDWLWLTAIQCWLLHHRKPLMKSCMSIALVVVSFMFPKVSRLERNTRCWTYDATTPASNFYAVSQLGFLNIKRSSTFANPKHPSFWCAVNLQKCQDIDTDFFKKKLPSRGTVAWFSAPCAPFSTLRCNLCIQKFKGCWERSW